MPVNLDSCITGIFVPGNIGASSGQPPIVRVMPIREPTVVTAAIVEAAHAAAAVNAPIGAIAVSIVEAATAVDTLSVSGIITAAMSETAAATDATTVVSIMIASVSETAAAADVVDWVTTFTTWDPTTVTAVTLSGGNLVATNTGTTSSDQGAKGPSTAGKSTGKYYFEAVFTTILAGGADYGAGVGTPTSTYLGMGFNNGTTGGMVFRSGNMYTNGSLGASLGARASGDVIGIAVDFVNRRIWFRVAPSGNWNNSGTANPATNTGGFTLPTGTMVPFATFGASPGLAGNVITGNFGASAFTGAVPSGFTSGWVV